MNVESMIVAAKKQQELTGKADAAVSVFVPGKWGKNDRKRLAGHAGPYGYCAAEFEDAVLCIFKADEVIAFCERVRG